MKKCLVFMGILAVSALPLLAEMDSKTYTLQAIADATNSVGLVLRGTLEAVKIDCVGVSTGTVKVSTAELTAFEKATIGVDSTYLPRTAVHTTAGVASTFVGGTNNAVNAWLDKAPLAGLVTVRLIGESAAGTTNNMIVTVVYNK